MPQANFPFYVHMTPAVDRIVGPNRAHVAVLALRAMLRSGHGFAVAHQQIRYRGHDLAFSSRVTANGELVVEIDVGLPAFRDRIVLEEDLRRAMPRRR